MPDANEPTAAALARLEAKHDAMIAMLDRVLAAKGRGRADFDLVGDFHAKFGLPTAADGPPTELPPDVAIFRVRFLAEELAELAAGYGLELRWDVTRPLKRAAFDATTDGDGAAAAVVGRLEAPAQCLPQVFDGLLDLAYVALGTAHMHRFPWAAGFAEVQRANMSKERASSSGDARSTRGHALDVVKPAGFRPPDVAGALMAAGWPGPRLPLPDGPPRPEFQPDLGGSAAIRSTRIMTESFRMVDEAGLDETGSER